jgi:hypothetical protein
MVKHESQLSDAEASFGPETEFESDTSISDKAFLQADAVNPIAMKSNIGEAQPGADSYEPLDANEEFAADMAVSRVEEAGNEEAEPGMTIGLAGLLIALVSLFVLPSILGPAAVVIGFMAFVKGRRSLGVWSMALGVISFVAFLVSLQNQWY